MEYEKNAHQMWGCISLHPIASMSKLGDVHLPRRTGIWGKIANDRSLWNVNVIIGVNLTFIKYFVPEKIQL